MKFEVVQGNLINLALEGEFDVIAHGCNCFCVQGAGLAKEMKRVFDTNNPERYLLEAPEYKGEYQKLGCLEAAHAIAINKSYPDKDPVLLDVLNCYTQYHYQWNSSRGDKPPVVYSAIALCMMKINHLYKGKRVGLPKIGCGLAGGDWDIVQSIYENELTDVKLTVVELKK